jgi:hypothetical protein
MIWRLVGSFIPFLHLLDFDDAYIAFPIEKYPVTSDTETVTVHMAGQGNYVAAVWHLLQCSDRHTDRRRILTGNLPDVY